MKLKTLINVATAALVLGSGAAAPAMAQTTPFVGQIKVFGFDFCPSNFAPADGQLLQITDSQALFALYGTQFGGNGYTTFAMPNLQNRMAVGEGQGPGLSTVWQIGTQNGASMRTLSPAQMPAHSHALGATSSGPASADPTGRVLVTFAGVAAYAVGGSNDVTMNSNTVGSSGEGHALSVQDPVLSMTICVALTGIYPAHNSGG